MHHASSIPSTTPTGPNPLQIPAILMIVFALLITVGSLTKGWATSRELGDGGAGLTGMKACGRGSCVTVGWDVLEKQAEVPSDVGTFGYLGLITGLLAAAGCAAVGGLALARKADKFPVLPLLIGLNVAAFCATFFTFRLLTTDEDIALSVSWAPIVVIGSLVAAAAVLHRVIKPKLAGA